jgi:hypothetical protein
MSCIGLWYNTPSSRTSYSRLRAYTKPRAITLNIVRSSAFPVAIDNIDNKFRQRQTRARWHHDEAVEAAAAAAASLVALMLFLQQSNKQPSRTMWYF